MLIHGSANHQKDNISGPQGGAVDLQKKMATGPIPFLIPIALVSTSPADATQTYLIEGLGPTRAVESEIVQLTGAEIVETEREFTRLCRVQKQSGGFLLGNVTVSAGTSIIGVMDAAINSGTGLEVEEIANFLANTMGRATVDSAFYEKFFIRNDTGATIGTLEVSEHQSDFKERILFAADPGFNGTSTSRNRLTKPGALIPGDFLTDGKLTFMNMPSGASIGIWLRLLIPAGEGTVLNGWKIKVVADGVVQIIDLLHPEGSGLTGTDIFNKRDLHPIGGGNPLRFIELRNAKFVQQLFHDPDPITFRDQFYYNTRLNRLFKKITTAPVPVWKTVR